MSHVRTIVLTFERRGRGLTTLIRHGAKGDPGAAGASDWEDVANKPGTFPPSSHAHDDLYYPKADLDTQFETVFASLDDEADIRATADTAEATARTAAITAAVAAINAAMAAKAPLASPPLTGTPTAPTASAATNNTQLATTAFVQTAIASLINSAPGALDTLGEIAAQLASDESVVSSLITTVSGKLAKSANLSDLTDAAAARTNLGLGTLATLNAAAAGTLTGSTLASGVLASSLTSVGTLAGLTTSGARTYQTGSTFSYGDAPASAAHRAALGLGTGDGPTWKNAVFTGQSLTGSQATSLLDLSTTWNTTGTPTAILLTVTDTASNNNSKLFDLRKGASSMFYVDKWGAGVFANALQAIQYNANNFYSINGDAVLARDAANIFAQRNGTNAQAFRFYNTYTDASNYERGFMRFASNVLEIGSESGGTGLARAVMLVAPATQNIFLKTSTNGLIIINQNGADTWRFAAHINSFEPTTTNSQDIGRPTQMVRAIYVGNLISKPSASLTPANNGELVFEATSNTSLTIKFKGGDGTVRSAVLTLS